MHSFLLLDAGNSALKWGRYADLSPERQTGGSIALSELDFAARVAAMLQSATRPAAIRGCTVTGSGTVRTVEELAALTLGLPVTWYGAQERFEHGGVRVENGYRDPSRLGADRWHALLAARSLHPDRTVLVVGAGTAVTVDSLLSTGRFAGGTISPGIELMRTSLARGTAQLPQAAGQWRDHPDETEDAIRTGILDAAAGLVRERLRWLAGTSGDPEPAILLTGGSAAVLAERLRAGGGLGTMTLQPDLVLRGLWLRSRAERAAP